jgi:hypothetical protein
VRRSVVSDSEINKRLEAIGVERLYNKMLDSIVFAGMQAAHRKLRSLNSYIQDFALLDIKKGKSFKQNIWLADTAATSHFTNSKDGLENIWLTYSWLTYSEIKTGKSGTLMIATKIGDKRLRCVRSNGEEAESILKDVKIVPELVANLISIPATLKRGFSLRNIGKQIYIQKGEYKLTFDKLFKSGNSFVCGVELIRIGLNLAMPTLGAGASVSFNEAHVIRGHVGT